MRRPHAPSFPTSPGQGCVCLLGVQGVLGVLGFHIAFRLAITNSLASISSSQLITSSVLCSWEHELRDASGRPQQAGNTGK